MPVPNLELRYFTALTKLKDSEVDTASGLTTPTTIQGLVDELSAAHTRITTPEERLWVLAYLDYKVLWGSYSPEFGLILSEEFEPRYLRNLRLFGVNGEWHLWRVGEAFSARLRLDKAEEPKFIDAANEKNGFSQDKTLTLPEAEDEWRALWGTQAEDSVNGWTRIFEDRGANLLIPHTLRKEEQNKRLPLRLLTRQYLKYRDDNGLSYYYDMRLVELRDAELQKLPFSGEKSHG